MLHRALEKMGAFMKLIICIFAMSLSLNILAKDWVQIQKGSKVQLEKTLKLPKSGIIFPQASVATVIDRVKLNMIKIILYKVQFSECQDETQTSELELLKILQRNGKFTSVGAELSRDCLLEFYVEQKDLFSKSLF